MVRQPSKLQENLNWYLSLLAVFLFVVVPPIGCSLLYLSQVPEVIWEREDSLTYDRIWMYRERRPLGIAYQSQRVIRIFSATEVCVENNLQFFLWGRAQEAEAASTDQRMMLVNNRWQSTGEGCE
jgi:hypothetical protein